ncbi:hypothetical protein NQZ79_g8835 [Umbelopsis isabellina]|nr:hypothetical protein NQZ79_g8835 [Umbelopsis isabellina]
MPSWMLDRFTVWDSSYQSWSFSESRAILLDVNGAMVYVTDLETMRQLITHTLSKEDDRCVIKGLWMGFQYKANSQSASSAACLEVFDVVKSLVPCQILPEVPSQAGICKSEAAEKPMTSSIVQPSSDKQQMQPAQATQAIASQVQQPKREYKQQKLVPEQRQTLNPQPSGRMLPLYTQGQIQHHQHLLHALADSENELPRSMHTLLSPQPSASTQPLFAPESHQQQELQRQQQQELQRQQKEQQLPDCEMPNRELPMQLPVIDRTRMHRILHDPLFPAIVTHIESILCSMFT